MKRATTALFGLATLVVLVFLTTDFFNLTEMICLLSFLTVFHSGLEAYSEGRIKTGRTFTVISVCSIIFILTGIPF